LQYDGWGGAFVPPLFIFIVSQNMQFLNIIRESLARHNSEQAIGML